MLCVLVLGVGAQYGAETVVVDLVLVGHHEFAPPLLSLRALHLVLDYGLGGIEFRKVLAEVFVDIVVYFGQAQGAALDLLEDSPVGLEVLDGCNGVVRGTVGPARVWSATYP